MTQDTNSATASAPCGVINGFKDQGINKFQGIRYAAPPVGDNRFMPPLPLPPSDAPIDATKAGNRNFQMGVIEWMYNGNLPPEAQSEDCLFLNVCAPQDMTGPKPVMVWIHGGAFISGSGAEYDPTRIVQQNDVVVVTINYRLGIFGFLDLSTVGGEFASSVNLGIQDQIAALRWVRDNIAAFGGDPDNVTIFGESAGAGSIHALLGAPSAKGLFHKAMPFSGGETLFPPLDQLAALQSHLACDSADDCVAQLQAMPAEDLFQLQQDAQIFANASLDGNVITMPSCEAIKSGLASDIPILTGATKDDGTLLAPYYALNEEAGKAMTVSLGLSVGRGDPGDYLGWLQQTLGDKGIVDQVAQVWFDLFRSSALRVASTASQHGAGGWVYNFDLETDHELGSTHFCDVPFTFNWIEEDHPRLFVHQPTEANQKLADQWSATIAEFARNGSPNGHGLPNWPQYGPGDFNCMVINHPPQIVSNPDGDDMLALYKVI